MNIIKFFVVLIIIVFFSTSFSMDINLDDQNLNIGLDDLDSLALDLDNISNKIDKVNLSNNTIPPNCKRWFDGCNTCSKPSPKGPGMCTMMACRIDNQKPAKCLEYFEENEKFCTMQYAPVCGEIERQCIKAPCPPVKQTFSNKCVAKQKHAKILYSGECKDKVGPSIISHSLPINLNIPKNLEFDLKNLNDNDLKKINTQLGKMFDIEVSNKGNIEIKGIGKILENTKVLSNGKIAVNIKNEEQDIQLTLPKEISIEGIKNIKAEFNPKNKKINVTGANEIFKNINFEIRDNGSLKKENGKLSLKLPERIEINSENNFIANLKIGGQEVKITPNNISLKNNNKMIKVHDLMTVDLKKGELNLNNHLIKNDVLKKVLNEDGKVALRNENSRAIFEIKKDKKYNLLWFFEVNGEVGKKINASTGEVVEENEPWWSFLAF